MKLDLEIENNSETATFSIGSQSFTVRSKREASEVFLQQCRIGDEAGSVPERVWLEFFTTCVLPSRLPMDHKENEMRLKLEVNKGRPSLLWIGGQSYEVRTQKDVTGIIGRLQLSDEGDGVTEEEYMSFVNGLLQSDLPVGYEGSGELLDEDSSED